MVIVPIQRGALRKRVSSAAQTVKRFCLSFGTLHVFNTSLNMGYSLLFMLTLARTLQFQRYSEIVLLTAIGFYLQPIDQAVGRTAFRILRRGRSTAEARKYPQVVVMLCGHASLLILASLAIPLLILSPALYVENVGYLMFTLFINFWTCDLQSTAFALDLSNNFVRLSIVHRVLQFCALGVLWSTSSFVSFVAIAVSLLALFVFLAASRILRSGNVLLIHTVKLIRTVNDDGLRRDMGTLWNSLMATISDLVVLNSPYLIIPFLFGAGETLVIFDTVMKVARLAMAGSRTLAEIALPRHSRQLSEGNGRAARRIFGVTMVLCFAGISLPAIVMVLAGSTVFNVLLGPNDIMPTNTGTVAALLLFATGLYQPATLLLSYGGSTALVRDFTMLALPGCAIFASMLAMLRPTAQQTLWLYLAFVAAMCVVAVWFGMRSRGIGVLERLGASTES